MRIGFAILAFGSVGRVISLVMMELRFGFSMMEPYRVCVFGTCLAVAGQGDDEDDGVYFLQVVGPFLALGSSTADVIEAAWAALDVESRDVDACCSVAAS